MNFSHIAFLTATFIFFQNPTFAQEAMTNSRMHVIFQNEVDEMEGEGGAWQLSYFGRPLLVITDSLANRMRIFSPIIAQEDLESGQLEKMLEANFHSALDAKYSLYTGYVVSVFTHPLQELSEKQLVDAMRQVVVLAETFGTSYQSTEMIFGSSREEESPKINQSPIKEKKN